LKIYIANILKINHITKQKETANYFLDSLRKVTAAIAMSREVTASMTPEMALAPAVEAALTLLAQLD
jgi:hypothetical protein